MGFNIGNISAKVGETKKGCFDSIGGIFIGFILFAVAFIPTWCSQNVRPVSAEIEALSMLSPEQAVETEGLVKFSGAIEAYDDYDPIPFSPECVYGKSDIDVFWYDWKISEYYEERDSDGDVDSGWRYVEGETVIVNELTLDGIDVQPGSANTRFVATEDCSLGGIEEVGEEFLEVKWLPADDVGTMLIVGEMHGGRVSSGDPFFLSNMTNDQLVQKLAAEEKMASWGLTILSIVLFTIAFNLIIGPLLFVLKFVPIIGGGLRFMIFIGSLIVAVILVFMIKYIIAFWWVIVLLFAGGIALIVVSVNKKKAAAEASPETVAPTTPLTPEPSTSAATPVAAPATPATPAMLCPSCGDPIDPDEKFCDKCGRRVRCPKCGDPIAEGEKFCNSCGEKLE